jgi:hypothetical protein
MYGSLHTPNTESDRMAVYAHLTLKVIVW